MLIYFFSVELNQLCDAEAEEERIVPENQEDGDSSNDIAPDAAASGESTEDQANNPQDKNDIHPSIRKIIDKKIDFTGNTVTNILVVGDEYVIYEIKSDNVEDILKVFIHGFTKDSEKILRHRFAEVKGKYSEAKGLLYNSSNKVLVRNRIAHTLSSVLTSDKIDGDVVFNRLIIDVKNEINELTFKKLLYIIPTVIFLIIIFGIFLRGSGYSHIDTIGKGIVLVLLSSALGGSLSIITGASKIKFDEITNRYWCVATGCERVFLSIVTSSIACVVAKSGVAFQEMLKNNSWAMVVVMILAAFSESLVPSLLAKIEKKTE